MWQYANPLEPAEPSHDHRPLPVPGKRTLTAALQRRAASTMTSPLPAGAAASSDAGNAQPAATDRAAPAEPLADPFWFAGESASESAASESAAAESTAAAAPAADRLPTAVQRQMEASFGADFSDVRIGVGGEAAAHGALAFARGNELQFAPGHYDPTSTAGLELIGHELAHVVQQRQGRATAAQNKGGVVDDAALEAEADAAGARAARGLPAGLGASSLLSSISASSAPTQHKTTIAIAQGVAAKSVSRDLLWKLAAQYGVEKYAELFERTMLWWADDAVKSLAETVIEELSKTSIWAATKTFATSINPYLATLSTLRTLYSKIPEVIQNLIIFSIGRGMGMLFGTFLGPSKVDAIVNTALLDGGSFVAKIDWAYKQLFDIANAPASWAYNLVWSTVRSRFGSSAPSPAAALAEQVSGKPGPAEAEPKPSPAHEPAAEQEASGERAEPSIATAKPKAPTVDLRYLWLDVDAPTLARFEHQGRNSGGLELPFKFGVDIFNTKMATLEPQKLHLPWSGGFAIELYQLAIDAPAKFPPIFSIGEVVISKAIVTDAGLKHFAFVIKQMSFGEDVVVLSDVTGIKSETGLRFYGSALVNALGTKIKTHGKLSLDAAGKFEDAALTVQVLDQFNIIPGVLSLANPSVSGSIAKGGAISLGVAGDIDSTISFFHLTAKGAHLDYQNGKGSALSGGVKALTVQLGKHVTLSGADIEIDGDGLRAKELGFEYRYDANAPERGKEEMTALGGLGPDLLGYAGLSSLVIRGKVLGLRIGKSAQPLSIAEARVDVPRDERRDDRRDEQSAEPARDGAPPAPRERTLVPGVHYQGTQKEISKIGASAFGLQAELDLQKGSGSLKGAIDYTPPLPQIGCEWHFLPGVAVFASVKPSFTVGASLDLGAEMIRADAFSLSGKLSAFGAAKVTVTAGAQVGTALIAALRAGVFAEAAAKAEAAIGARGVIQLDRQALRLRASNAPEERPRATFAADASLTASLGVVVSGHAFLVFDKELYRHTFKEWVLGSYHVEGELDLASGKSTIDSDQSGFKGGKPEEPATDKKQTTVEEARLLLRKQGEPIIGSAAKRKELHQEIRDAYQGADTSTARRLVEVSTRHAAFKQEFVTRLQQMADRNEQDETAKQELAMMQAKLLEHRAKEAAARKDHYELQLMLVEGPGLTDEAIEAGELDLDALEASIRRAAALADESTQAVEGNLEELSASRAASPAPKGPSPVSQGASPDPSKKASPTPQSPSPVSGQDAPPSGPSDASTKDPS
jgi:uncharacterized membrane protein required for colicin V production